jgi:hypothetical protein
VTNVLKKILFILIALIIFCINSQANETKRTKLKGSFVDVNIDKSGNGTSWAKAFKTIQEAIDNTLNGNTIFIAGGVYNSTNQKISNNELSLVNINKSSIKLIGGFKGNEEYLEQRNPYENYVILDGENIRKVIEVFYVYNIEISDLVIVNGCSISDNSTDYFNEYIKYIKKSFGGGILAYKVDSLLFKNIDFINNKAMNYGAICAISCYKAKIINCKFSENFAEYNSAVLMLELCNYSLIKDCEFIKNMALAGGLSCILVNDCSKIAITNNRFYGNKSRDHLTILQIFSTNSFLIRGCEFINNKVHPPLIGSIYVNSSKGKITKNKFIKFGLKKSQLSSDTKSSNPIKSLDNTFIINCDLESFYKG